VSQLEDDLIQPFTMESSGLHGRLVRLGPALDAPLRAHDYPDSVAMLLGEAMALVAGLSGNMKFEGTFSLQARGDGPIKLMVADVATDGSIRGYADFAGPAPAMGASIPQLLGAGRLIFTIDQGPDTERYQGIVEIQGARLADCVQHYFRQSGQFTAGVVLACRRDKAGQWRGGALVLQRFPEEEDPHGDDGMEDAWRTAIALMGSCRAEELCDPQLSAHELLFRLFHEDGVRVFTPKPLAFACKCSRARMQAAIAMLSTQEIKDMTIDHKITVTCQFCNAERVFDPALLARAS
jgi:molecular chaperone Hsp33